MTPNNMRKCRSCLLDKPMTTEFYYRCPNTIVGLKSKCIICLRKQENKYQRGARTDRTEDKKIDFINWNETAIYL